jgi:broad specificity phosphatase PhoE
MSSKGIGAKKRIQRFFEAVASTTNGKSRKIIFVRHVESDWNVAQDMMLKEHNFGEGNLANTLKGWTLWRKNNPLVDPVATETGVKQALRNVGALRNVLQKLNTKVIAFSSPLKRCMETGALMTADDEIQKKIAGKVHVAPFLTEDGKGPDLLQVDDVETVKDKVREDVKQKAEEKYQKSVQQFLTNRVDDSAAFSEKLSSKAQIDHTTESLNEALEQLQESDHDDDPTPLLIFGHSNWGQKMMKMGKMTDVRKLDNAEVAVFDMEFEKKGKKWDFTIENAKGYRECGSDKKCSQCQDFTEARKSCSPSGADPISDTQLTSAQITPA